MRFQDESTDRKSDHRIDCMAGGRSPRPHSRLNSRWRQVAIATCLALWLPLPALSAKLVEVRVGRHTGYTRVVLQTDTPVEYTLTRSKSGNVRIEFGADASPRRLTSKSDVLREVIVENTGEGALARLRLHRSDVAVKEMVLKSPPRIVLDLTPGVPQPAVTAAAAEKPGPKAEAKPTSVAVKEEPKPDAADGSASARSKADASASAPSKEAVGAAATGAAAGGRLADSKTASAPEAKPAAPESQKTESATADAAKASRTASKDSEAAKVNETASKDADAAKEARGDAEAKQDAAKAKLAESGSTGEVVDPATEGVAQTAPSADRRRLREMPKPPPARRAKPPEPPAPAPTPGALAFLPAPFDDPLVLGGIAGLLVLIAALVAVRRRGASRAEEELDSPFASSEPFSAPESPQPATASFDVPASTKEASADGDLPGIPGQEAAADSGGPSAGGTAGFEVGDSLFAGEPEAEAEEEKETDARAFAPAPVVDLGETEAPALGGDVMRVVEELERRMGQMETRLEEVVDAKERLERQVSAQTEELRVQRAAIARTQRVLRNVSRPEDEATEPAPKV
ncbi:MAG: hypothetical protein OEP95_01285 [Myxococcales bacterium]|nr:hypothetical protein [Myxococcales bacterium]